MRTNIKNIIARQIAITGLYIPVRITIPTKIRLPKILLSKSANNEGTAKKIIHIATNTATKPRTKLEFF